MTKAKILIAEDERIIALDIKSLLERRGFEIIGIQSTGENVIREAKDSHPDIVLMDIILEGSIDGITAADEIRKKYDIPVIFLTAHSDEKTLNRAKEAQPYGYILKPINENELYSTIVTSLYKYELEKELKHEHKFFLSIAEASPLPITLVNREGKIIFANKLAEEMFGLSRDEITSRSYNSPKWQITDFDGNPYPEDQLPFHLVMKTGEPVANIRHAIETDTGRILLSINSSPIIDDSGNVEMVVFITQDITEQVRLESMIRKQYEEMEVQNEELQAAMEELEATNEEMEATNEELNRTNEELMKTQDELLELNRQLREKEEYLRGVFNAIQDGLSILDVDLTIREVNYWMDEMYSDYKPLRGKKCYTAYQNRNTPCPWCPSLRALETGKKQTEIVPYPAEENPTGWIELTAFPLLKDGRVTGVIEYVKDISKQKNAEQALRESEELYRNLVERANDTIGIIQDGVFKFINPRATEIFGYTPDEVIGSDVTKYLHPDELPKMIERYQKRFAGEELPEIYDTVLVHKNGTKVDVELSGGIITYGGRPADLIIMHNITERKRAEFALRESEAKYRDLIDHAIDIIYTVDPEGNFIDVNEAFLRSGNITPDKIIGRNFSFLVHPDDSLVALEAARKGLQGEPCRFEMRILQRDLSYEWFSFINRPILDSDGNPVAVHGIARNIGERKRVEQALQESERAYRELADLLPQTVFECDPTGKFTYTNQHGYTTFGYTVEDLGRGVNILDMMIPEDRERAVDNIQKLYRDEGHVGNEYTALRSDGSTFPIRIYSTAIIRDGKPAGLRGIVVDITEQKEAEQKLRESEERYRMIAENASDVIWIRDLNLNYSYISPSVFHMRGYTAEEAMKHTIDETLTPESTEIAKKALIEELKREKREKNLDPNRAIVLELEHIRKDGTTFPAEVKISGLRDDKNNLIGIYGVTRDISERKQAEEKYQKLVESISIAIFVTQDQKIKYINPKALDISGYSEEELTSKNFIEFIHPDDREIMIDRYTRRLKGEKISDEFHFRIIDKFGNTRWMEISAIVIDWEGKPAILNFMIDITERKIAEEKIRASLQEKEVLLKEIHHRTKNNMQIISSLLNIQSKLVRDEEDRDLFRESQQRVRSMALIHEKLYQSDDLSRINFSRYLETLVTELFRAYQISGKEIKLKTDITETHLDVNIAITCALIINELVSNSLKYAFPEGRKGTIHIKFHRDKRGKYTLSVRDTGVGIPQEITLEKIETLGLQLVTMLTKQLNGTVELQREKGTTFTITFEQEPPSPPL